MKGETIIISNALLNGAFVDITIDKGIISHIDPHTSHLSPFTSHLIEASGFAVFPGLCNMHSHAPMTLFRGLGDDQPLDVWLNDYIWPAEQKLTDELVYKGTLQACREMLASGTTAFNDMYFRLPAMAQAVKESGIRAMLGFNIFGDAEEIESLKLIIENSAAASNPLRYSIAPHSIYTVSEKGLRRCADACKELGVPMHIHMSETQKEVDDCLRKHGCRPWEDLDKLGILDKLGQNIIAAHCLHLSDNEIRLIGDQQNSSRFLRCPVQHRVRLPLRLRRVLGTIRCSHS